MQWHGSDGETHQYDAPDSSGSPLDQLLEMQSDDQLAGCLGALDDEPRQAILLAYFEGLTHVELARRLGRPLGTVKAWVRRSLGQLRECLGEPA